MHLKQFPSEGYIARTSMVVGSLLAAEKKIEMGLADAGDLLSRENRSSVNRRGGAKSSRQRWVVDRDMDS
jgi:hypothetical protein